MSNLVKYSAKSGIYQSKVTAVLIPEDLSIFEFMFDYAPPAPVSYYDNPAPARRRPWEQRKHARWLTDALTGRSLTAQQCLTRTEAIARALSQGFSLGHDDVLGIFSGNEVDFPLAVWAAFRLGGIVSCANPAYRSGELSFQLSLVGEHHPVKALLVAPDTLPVAYAALQEAGLSTSLLILISAPAANSPEDVQRLAKGIPTLDDLIAKYAHAALPPIVKINAKSKLAFLSFSSGTTGRPKAVSIQHYALIANVLQCAHGWDVSSPGVIRDYDPATGFQEKTMAVLPFFHIYGLVVVLHYSLFVDSEVVTLNKFNLVDFCTSIDRFKITLLYIVPPIAILLVKSPIVSNYDLSSVRIGMTGAAPLTEETGLALSARLPNLIFGQGYGMTETCTIISIFVVNGGSLPRASAGVFAPMIEAKVVSPEGKTLGFGEVGELWTRSPSNALGYLGNQKATDETWDADGFVHTGDEVYVCPEGWLYVVDRIKELIKVSGNQVAPAELEGFLLGHPAISDCCVIGIPHDYRGEVPKAYIALSPDAIAEIAKDPSAVSRIIESVKKFVKDNKISYKQLGEVEILDVIPKTASGKLLRKDLRVLHAAQAKSRVKL